MAVRVHLVAVTPVADTPAEAVMQRVKLVRQARALRHAADHDVEGLEIAMDDGWPKSMEEGHAARDVARHVDALAQAQRRRRLMQ